MTEKATATKTNYKDLFAKIDQLQGLEKGKFTSTLTLEEKKAYIKYCNERDSDLVTGTFRCFEPAGGSVELTYLAYEAPPQKITFQDGKEYTIPRYLAKRMETEFQGVGTWYPTHSHIMDANGVPTVAVGKKNRRFGFAAGF